MTRRVRRMLEAADPARGVQVGPGDVEALLDRARNDVTARAATGPPRRWGFRLVPVGAFAAVVVAATAIAVVRLAAGSAGSPEPYLPPGSRAVTAPCLASIADRLAATPYDGHLGRYEYLRLSEVSGGSVEIPGVNAGTATMWQREDTTQWLAEDGSGRVRVVSGAPTFPDERSREFFAQHRELRTTDATRTNELAPGDFNTSALPAADPAALEQALYQPRENGPTQALLGVAGLNRERVLGFAHREAVLRFLATTDGVVCRGEDTDPTGRTGIMVSAGRGPGPAPSPANRDREYLLFDPRTGELLASSATGAGEWSIVYLERGRTDELG